MSKEGFNLLEQTGTITAAAGCGKTHQIVGAAKRHASDIPLLILTHTNAGVAALRSRLNVEGVDRKSYRLATLDGWAMSLITKFPARSEHDPVLLNLADPKNDYPEISNRAAALLKSGCLDSIISASYDRLIVDEYQDCSTEQHAYVTELAGIIPTVVLGDPLQGIFGFGNRVLVDWEEDVQATFGVLGDLDTPYRWYNVDANELGDWLIALREPLLDGLEITLEGAPEGVVWQQLTSHQDNEGRIEAARVPPPNEGGSVLVIGDSYAKNHSIYARAIPGANRVENVDLSALVAFASDYDINDADPVEELFASLKAVMSTKGLDAIHDAAWEVHTGNQEPSSETEDMAARFIESRSYYDAAVLIASCGRRPGTHVYRRTIYEALIKTFRLAANGMELGAAARQVREEGRISGRSIPSHAVGSTLLLKGLETDAAVIMDPRPMTRNHLYVALTRGSRRLTVCSTHLVIKEAGRP